MDGCKSIFFIASEISGWYGRKGAFDVSEGGHLRWLAYKEIKKSQQEVTETIVSML
jgi:hypothetical protein